MILVRDLFSPSELDLILCQQPSAQHLAPVNPLWNHSLTEGHTGLVESALASHWIHNLIERRLQRPPCQLRYSQLVVQWNRWHRDSAINPHTDSRYLWAGTVYLNTVWLPQWGGLFCWQDAQAEIHQHCPQYNSAVFNTCQELHWVTVVTGVSLPRLTLQIWAH